MSVILEAESTLTDRYQTTVPESVRRALHLNKRDKIQYVIRPDGEVVLRRASIDENADPALLPFLALLANDMSGHPDRLAALDPGLVEQVEGLVDGVVIDLDAPLPGEDE